MTKQVVDLCEMCGEKVDGMAVVWRRGFTAVCCVGCACELSRLLRERRIIFSAKNPKQVAAILIRSRKRPSWDEASQRVLEDRHELWEALATV